MNKREKAKKVVEILEKRYEKARIALNYNTEYQLLVAVILSAQCTDKRVNIVTKDLFKVVKEPIDIYDMDILTLEKYIKSTGFYKNKAKNLKLNAKQLIEQHNGKIPREMDSLLELAGVGRKTANVVLGDLWGKTEGIVVDTHVRRISNLLGLVDNNNPVIIEKELMKILAKKNWYKYSHFLILHGRETCIARRPKCLTCSLNMLCNYYSKNKKILGSKYV